MLRPLDRDLWCLDSDLRLAPGFHLPIRTTLARLASGGLWLHSPIAIDDPTAAALAELGPVEHIVAPSLLHHLFAAAAHERWPAATLHAPASLASKQPKLAIDRPLAEDSRWPELAIVQIAGAPSIDEHIFVHRPSGTLIVTDLLFNVHEVAGVMSPLILRMVGAWRKLAQSRVWRSAVKDRGAAKASVERLLALEFGRLVPAHGEVIEGSDTRERVRAALHWMQA